MYTHSLCRGQIIDAVPAHLQQQKRYKQADQCLAMCRGTPQTEMDICQIGKPGSRRPSLFRVPCPIVSPSSFCPDGTGQHTQRHESKPYISQVIAQSHLMPFNPLLLEPQQVDSHHRSGTQHGVGKHINNDMRSEPRALQGGHQSLIVYFGLEYIDADKHQ